MNSNIQNWLATKWPKKYKQLVDENIYDQKVTNNLQKLNKTLIMLRNVLEHQQSSKCKLYTSIMCLNLIKYKSRIYKYLDKLSQMTNFNEIVFLLLKPTGPINIKYVYNIKTRKQIADQHFEKYIHKSAIWYDFKTHRLPAIAYGTVLKIIRQDSRYINLHPRKAKIKHPLRLYNLEFGLLQMDLKIVGPTESPTGERIIIFDAKDEQSKIYFMKIIEDGSKKNLLAATIEMIDYFNHKINMKIKRVRTDNAMVFKDNNFVKSYEFANLLKKYGIKQEHIPLGQPQCNGVIECQHRLLDPSFLPRIKATDTLKTMQLKAKNFMHHFNFERAHYMSFLAKSLEYKSFYSRFKIPYNFFLKSKYIPPKTNINPSNFNEISFC